LHFVLKTILVFAIAFLASCSEPKFAERKLPNDVDKVTSGFVTALGKGDIAAARKFVAPSSQEEFDLEFEEQQENLGELLKLKPMFLEKAPKILSGPFDNDVTVVYAAEKDGKWTFMEINLFWLEEENIEIASWNFQTETKMPAQLSAQRFTMRFVQYGMPVIGIFAAIFLAFFVWFIRRKPQIVSPPMKPDQRKSAVTSRSRSGGE